MPNIVSGKRPAATASARGLGVASVKQHERFHSPASDARRIDTRRG
jgi:hypothetical protein